MVSGQALAASGPPIGAQLLYPIFNPAPATTGNFGKAMSAAGDDLLVGARGFASVIDTRDGSEKMRLTSPETVGTPFSFGDAVAGDENWIAVSDTSVDLGGVRNAGSVYVFDSSGTLQSTIRNTQTGLFDRFGSAMALVDGSLYVADASTSVASPGDVRIYSPSTGALRRTISNPGSSTGFGFDIREYEDDVFISAIGGGLSPGNPGVLYRFDARRTAPKLTIPSPDRRGLSEFGRAFEANGGLLLVGAPGMPSGGQDDSGKAYLYDADTGDLVRTIDNPEPGERVRFGDSVALLDRYIVVGAPGLDLSPAAGARNVGAFFVFDRDTGLLIDKVFNPTPTQNEQFTSGGRPQSGLLSIGGRFFGSSDLEVVGGFDNAGAVFAYSVVPEPGALVLCALAGCALAGRRCR